MMIMIIVAMVRVHCSIEVRVGIEWRMLGGYHPWRHGLIKG
jgi:hypothetical protein